MTVLFGACAHLCKFQFVGQLSKPDMHIILYLVSYILYLLRGFLRSVPLTILLKIPRCALRTGGSTIWIYYLPWEEERRVTS